MRKILLLIPLVIGVSSMAFGAACTSGTLATYDAAGFSCTLGDLTFSNFSYVPAGSTTPTDAQVAVTPVTTGFGDETGLLFTAAWLAGTGQIEDSSITFTASTSNRGGITDLFLQTVGGTTGDSIASVSEVSANPALSLTTVFENGVAIPTDSTTFPPVGSLTVTKDIGLVGGSTQTSIAHISDVYNLFSQGTTTTTPEPSLTILCVGLLGLIPVARRKFGF